MDNDYSGLVYCSDDDHVMKIPHSDRLSFGDCISGKILFTITYDGDVILSEGVEWTEAATRFWDYVDSLRPGSLFKPQGDGPVGLPQRTDDT